MSMVDSGLTLELRLLARTPTLLVAFRLLNGTGRNWGVFSRVPSRQLDGTPGYAATAAYVDIEGDSLILGKHVLQLPPGLQVTARVLPGIVVARNHTVLGETIAVPVPVLADNPYRRAALVGQRGGADVAAKQPGMVARATLRLGVFPLLPEEKLIPLSPAFPDVFRCWPPGRAAEAQVILTATVALDPRVAVLDYD